MQLMLPPLQMLSRTKPAAGPGSPMVAKDKQKQKKKIPKMDDFLNARDYTGAITLLEVRDYPGAMPLLEVTIKLWVCLCLSALSEFYQ